ncbi:MAG TPA: hypothetical protein VF821_32720, partial [Lentzea sp.]
MKILPRLRRTATRLTRDTAFLALGAPLHLLTGFLLFVICGSIWAIIEGSESTTPIILGFLVAVTALCVPALTAAQRWRFRQLLGIAIPRPSWRHPWRQLGYHSLSGLLFGTLETLVVTLLLTAVAAALSPLWIYALPLQWQPTNISAGALTALAAIPGLALLATLPSLAAALVRLETHTTPTLLGPSREEALARQVENLTESRAGAVD